jgi:tRNA threonylcarbamoyladenosine modification (KEOPS) complex  Pcc1 subunit
MAEKNSYSIESKIRFKFDNSHTRDFSFNAYSPELDMFKSDRTNVIMSKKGSRILEFKIKSKDITAFRASMNDIVGLGKVIEGVSFLRRNHSKDH